MGDIVEYRSATSPYVGAEESGTPGTAMAMLPAVEYPVADVLPIYERQRLARQLEQLQKGYMEIGSLLEGRLGNIAATLKDVKEGVDILVGLRAEETETVFIGSLRNPKYELVRPIPVILKYLEDEVIARYDDTGLYGAGELRQEALDDLCESIIEYFETLSEERDNLGPLPESHWEFLKDIIKGKG